MPTPSSTPPSEAEAGPLDGLLVVSLEQAVAAPLCTARLRQGGARVIKIERPEGDFARAYDSAAGGESSYFTWTNQGKESLVLDIKQTHDLSSLRSILSRADVFVQNLAPGAVDRLGLGNELLRQHNTTLITCDISGYGDDESVRHLKAYDLLVQAESGLVSVSGGPGEMGRIGVSLCDIGAGVTAHAAILEALIKRGITGRGEHVQTSLFDVAAEWMTVPFIHARYGAGAPQRQGLMHPSVAPYGAYRTADKIDTLIAIQNEREWQRFCEIVLESSALSTDPLFSSNALRVTNRTALDATLLQTIAKISSANFRQRLGAATIAYGAINSVEDLIQHTALRTQIFANSAGNTLTLPAHPFSRTTPAKMRTPRIGEHTDMLKTEFNLNGNKNKEY